MPRFNVSLDDGRQSSCTHPATFGCPYWFGKFPMPIVYVRTHGDNAARFHVLALNWSGNHALIMSGVGIESPFAVPLASIVPPHCAQFRLSSKCLTNST